MFREYIVGEYAVISLKDVKPLGKMIFCYNLMTVR